MEVLVPKPCPTSLNWVWGRRRTEQIYKTDKALRSICLSDGMTRKGVRAAFSYSASGNGQTTDI